MGSVTVNVLGPVGLTTQTGGLTVPRGKQRLLLASLAGGSGGVTSVDALTDALWPGRQPADPTHALENQVSRLRKLLGGDGETIRRTATGYEFTESVDVDAHRFEELITRGSQALSLGDAAEGLGLLRAAERLWGGTPFSDLADGPGFAAEVTRLQELRRRSQDARFDAELALGSHEDVLEELAQSVREDPLDERRRAQLMTALYRAGRQGEALAIFDAGVRVLEETLGVDPGPELRDVHLGILRQELPGPGGGGRASAGAQEDPFVGREPELAAWTRLSGHLRRGRGGVLLFSGEPGIGKSRLLEEVGRSASGLGFELAWGRCREETDAPPYWPWTQLLRSLQARGFPVDGRAALLIEDGSGAAGGGPAQETERFELFDDVMDLLVHASRGRPLLVVLDDLHAADRSSLQLLDVAADVTRRAPIGFVGAYRDSDAERRGVGRRLTRMARSGELVAMRGLTREQTAQLLHRLLREEPSRHLIERVHQAGDGNPLFTTELARDLPRRGQRDDADLRIPPALAAVLRDRLDALEPLVRHCLEAMAVLGRQAELSAVASVADVDQETVFDAMPKAATAGIIRHTEHGATRFVHVLFRDLLEGDLPAERRLRFHERSVAWMEALPPDRRRHRLPEIAQHHLALLPRNGPTPAASWLERAADAAAEDVAWEQAADLYETALEHTVAPHERVELLLRQAEMRRRAGEGLAAMAAFEAAYEAADAAGRVDLMARAAIGCEDARWRGAGFDDAGPVLGLLEGALDQTAEDEVATRAALFARLSRAAHYWDVERAAAAGLEAGRLAGQLTDPAEVAIALEGQHWGLWTGRDRPTFDERRQLAERMLTCAHAAGDDELTLRALVWNLHDLVEGGDLPALDLSLPRLAATARTTHQPRYVDWTRLCEAMRLIRQGHYEQARQLQVELLERAQRIGDANVMAVHLGQRIIEAIDRGGPSEDGPIRDDLVEYVATSPALGRSIRALVPLLHAEFGELDRAQEAFAGMAVDGFASVPPSLLWSTGATALALATPLLGEQEAAATLLDLLRPWAGTIPMSGPEAYFWPVDLGIGAAALTAGEFATARRHLSSACDLLERLDAPAWLTRARLHLAQALSDGPDPKPPRAAALLDSCVAVSDEFGLRTLGERARSCRADL